MDWATSTDDIARFLSLPGNQNESIAQTLNQRVTVGRPHTWIGSDVLLSLNHENNQINNMAMLKEYAAHVESLFVKNEESVSDLPPSILELACLAFYEMLYTKQDQGILLSGMSGSGKSFNRNLISSVLVQLARNGKKKSRVLSGATKMETVLESFGHATTDVNPNASFFGRFVEYQYTQQGRMIGLKLLDYGLDATRATAGPHLPLGHRTFHIFYQMMAGLSSDEKERFRLTDPNHFVYLKGAAKLARSGTLGRSGTVSRNKEEGTSTLSRIVTLTRRNSQKKVESPSTPHQDSTTAQDLPKFQQLKDHLKSLGIGRRLQSEIFKVLAAILHLGNVSFATDLDHPQDICLVKNFESLEIAADLLDLGSSQLKNSLLYKSKLIGRELCSVVLKPEEATHQRDALATTLYSLLFSWIVEHINARLCKPEEEVESLISVVDFPWYRAEHAMGYNADLDTLYFNYGQERLTLLSHQYLFDEPMNMFKQEHIQIATPSYQDNLWSMDVFRGTPRQEGLFALLDASMSETREPSFVADLLTKLDTNLKQNPHYIPSFKCSSGATTGSGTPKSYFGIRHHHQGPSVEYDLESFMERDTITSDFVALFRGTPAVLDNGSDTSESSKTVADEKTTFVASLFSTKTGLLAQKSKKGAVVGAMKPTQPLRKPSMRRKKQDKKKSKHQPVFETAASALDDIQDTLLSTNIWSVFCIKSDEQGQFDADMVQSQLSLLSVSDLAFMRATYDVDVRHGMTFDAFLSEYSSLLATKNVARSGGSPRDMTSQFIQSQWWGAREFALGSTQLFLSRSKWRWLRTSLKRLNNEDELKASASLATLQQDIPRATSSLSLAQLVAAPASVDESANRYEGFDGSDVESNYESEYSYMEEPQPRVLKGSKLKEDVELGKMEKTPVSPNKREHIEKVTKITKERKLWVCCTWCLTWWIPHPFLVWCGKMKRPDIRMAWREKVALCIIIAFLCLALLFFIVGLGWVICRPSNVRTQSEIALMSNSRRPYVSAYGRYYYVADIIDSHKRDFGSLSSNRVVQDSILEEPIGKDVSRLFYKHRSWGRYCPDFPAPPAAWDNMDQSLLWQRRSEVSRISLHDGLNTQGQPQLYLEYMNQFARGPIGWSRESVRSLSSGEKVYVIIFKNVYYLSTMGATGNSTFNPQLQSLLLSNYGKDLTEEWRRLRSRGTDELRQQMDAMLSCMNQMFYIGTVDERDTVQCRFTNAILLAASIVFVAVIGIKFLAALQFGSRKDPEDCDKFVICMVPCYTEGADSLNKTLDSLSTLKYDDKRKLLFVICDGMIIGSGNDRPTPRIVLDILGVDPSEDPEPLAFQSLGEGNRQLNYGKVYSGLYDIRGHSVPFVVVVKVGAPSERVKPGNRGKRDSQMILMRFLSRVHFNAEFSPLELEMYHHMRDIIGVSPSFYEFVLMVDADTEVETMALNRMVSVMVHDVRVMGLCGETRISNEKTSWVTAIQVYEYFISHHMAKAFESLFGTVTCLPGCFCMYRIRTASKNVPLLVSPGLITDYAENTVDTLHMKNLLHLGEDRYLTTLMLKHFPNMRTKFTAEAKCSTVAPDRWSVLLSQRRRWINSTVHNLFELMFLEQLCGFCCFSMRFIVFLDLFSTFVQPATVIYIAYLIYVNVTNVIPQTFPLTSLILVCAIYGFQAIIFILKREWQHVIWMIIYLLALPVFSFWIPCYAFWHFDDFSWGNTRVVIGEGKKTIYVADTEPFDPKSIPMRRWRDFEENELWERGSVVSGTSHHTTSTYQKPQRVSFSSNQYDAASEASFAAGSVYNRPPSIASGGTSAAGSVYNYPINNSLTTTPVLPPNNARHSMLSQSSIPGPYAASDSMPTDEQLLVEVKRILSNGDLMTLTKKQIRENLSKLFGVDLKPKKDVINRMVDGVLQGRL